MLEQGAQGGYQCKQFSRQNMALAHVDDLVRTLLAKPDDHALADRLRMQGRPSARTWRGDVRRRGYHVRDPLSLCRTYDAIVHVFGQRILGQVLQLATAAGGKVPTRRIDVVGTVHQRTISLQHIAGSRQRRVSAVCRCAFPLGGNTHDQI